MPLVNLSDGNQPQAPELHTCGNCGRMIGGMEQSYQWGDAVVCPQCCQSLQSAAMPVPEANYSPPRRRRYVDHLKGAKITLLILAILVSVMSLATGFANASDVESHPERILRRLSEEYPLSSNDPYLVSQSQQLANNLASQIRLQTLENGGSITGYILWVAWFVLVLVSMSQKANFSSMG